MSEFKEFWIKITSFDKVEMGGFRYSDAEISIDPDCVKNYADFKNAVHVIEYKAYSKLKEENEFLRAAFKREITKLNDINASDYDKYEQEITDLKHDHKIMLDALESLSTGLAFAQGFISVHSTEAELFVTKQYENYKEAISQLKHKENI